jgi:Leucine-rich repeat (LRR) protein
MRNVLPIIFSYLSNRDVLRIAFTCKRLYTFCRDTKEVWRESANYSMGFIWSIYRKHISILRVSKLCNKKEIFRDIQKMDNIKQLCIEYKAFMYVHPDITELNTNITILEIHCVMISDNVITKLISNDVLVSLVLLFDNFESGSDIPDIDRIGKSLKRLTVWVVNNGEITRRKYKNNVEGLQILELYSGIVIDIKTLKGNVGTLVVINIFIDFVGGLADATYLYGEMTELVELYEQYFNPIPEEHIRNLTKMERLEVCNIDGIRSDTFANMPNLRYLLVDSNTMANINFKTLVQLKELRVLGDEIPIERLFCLKDLEKLYYNRDNDRDTIVGRVEEIYKIAGIYGENPFPKLVSFEYKEYVWNK